MLLKGAVKGDSFAMNIAGLFRESVLKFVQRRNDFTGKRDIREGS